MSSGASSERKKVSLGDRWRQIGARGAAEAVLEQALATLPNIRHPRLRIRPGSIQTEMEGAMGSINEVSVHVPRLSEKIWPQVARIMRRSPTMVAALQQGKVPRAFDRLLLRVSGESVFPDPRRVTHGCTCGSPESPCPHVLALHELYARRLDDKPYELLALRGVNLRALIEEVQKKTNETDLPPLGFGAKEEPVLFPEGEDAELDSALGLGEVRDLLASQQRQIAPHVDAALEAYLAPPPAAEEDRAEGEDGTGVDHGPGAAAGSGDGRDGPATEGCRPGERASTREPDPATDSVRSS